MAVSQLQQQNIAAAAAYTEYSVAIPPGAIEVSFVLRPGGSSGSATPANIFWYMTSTPNGSNNAAGLPTTYNTIPIATSRTIIGKLGGQTVYFQVDKASQVMEVDYHSDT